LTLRPTDVIVYRWIGEKHACVKFDWSLLFVGLSFENFTMGRTWENALWQSIQFYTCALAKCCSPCKSNLVFLEYVIRSSSLPLELKQFGLFLLCLNHIIIFLTKNIIILLNLDLVPSKIKSWLSWIMMIMSQHLIHVFENVFLWTKPWQCK
jgi:hypothetical protein